MPPQRNGFGGSGRGRGGARGGRNAPLRPKLPSALQDQVDAATGGSKRKGNGQATRKEIRKATRQAPRLIVARNCDQEDSSSEDDQPVQPIASSSKTIVQPTKRPLSPTPLQDEKTIKKKKKKLPELTLPGAASGPDKEDGEIEWLEWMLKKKKSGGKGKGKEEEDDLDDGLDDLLEFADIIGPGGKGLPVKETADDSDLDMESEDSGDEDEIEEEDEEVGDSSALENEEEDQADLSDTSDQVSEEGTKDLATEPWNGIQPVDTIESRAASEGEQTATRYVPPHMRAALLEEKAKGDKGKVAELGKLERKAQGLLNKLSEANLDSILKEIEELYREHSRNDVTTTITNLIIQMISNKANLLDSFVVLYATLVGALHRVIGMEFGAHFLHTLVMRYNRLSISPNDDTPLAGNIYETPDASKESLNLLVLIAELYNAGVVSSKLIYDLIRGFLGVENVEEGMDEKAVESLLKILRCSGAQLRTDDPASLKDIVALVQERTKGKEKVMTSRARFMIETLTNVKNGKIKATSGTEQGVAATSRMKQFLNGLGKKRRLLAYEPLRVSLSDLIAAETKGKWWLVGAGWSGNPLVDRQPSTGTIRPTGKEKRTKDVKEDEEVLLELARKQGMNTEVRRSVFVVLMTSEDYLHACDRLSQFKLSETQQREFVRVALHCCGLEKTYNPYYTLILSNLLQDSYSHRFTLQYALWDFLRELGETGVGGSGTNAGERFGGSDEVRKVSKERIANVAKALAFIVARGTLDLSVFKAVDFTSLRSATVTFLTTFLIYTLISTQTTSPLLTLPKAYTLQSSFDPEPLEEMFDKTLSNLELAQGWLWVIESEMGGKISQLGKGRGVGFKVLEGLGEKEKGVVKAGLEIARSVLGRAI